jgi:hypothetical protein
MQFDNWKRARMREVSPRRRTEHEESVRLHVPRQTLNSNEGVIIRARRGNACHGEQSAVTAFCQRTVGEHSLSGYGPINSVNSLVRTRMNVADPVAGSGVGAGG